VTLAFDIWVNACQAAAIRYTRTKFGVDSSSRFPFKAWTNTQTDRQTRMNALPTPAAMPVWVTSTQKHHREGNRMLLKHPATKYYTSKMQCSYERFKN